MSVVVKSGKTSSLKCPLQNMRGLPAGRRIRAWGQVELPKCRPWLYRDKLKTLGYSLDFGGISWLTDNCEWGDARARVTAIYILPLPEPLL